MTIYDFLSLITDDSATIAIYDIGCGDEVFRGEARDALFCDFSECDVQSFDIDPFDAGGAFLILNIDTVEEGITENYIF